MRADALSSILAEPESLARLSLADWDLIIRQARNAQLLARLERICAEHGWLEGVPIRARCHLEAARRLCKRQHCEVRWEVDRIKRALAHIDTPIVLLKGAAYVMAGLPPATGRMFADIDIMVARDRLSDVESALSAVGWLPEKLDPYDQRYYRTWGHELPPLRHVVRGTVLDVHHTITQPTSQTPVDPKKLLSEIRPLDITGKVFILGQLDLTLHSAAHLFQEGDFDHGLRDLVDFAALVGHFGRAADYWPALVERAAELGLGRPLYYTVEQVGRVLRTAMPLSFVKDVNRFRPPLMTKVAMTSLLRISIRPNHPTCDSRFTSFARWLLFARAHYIRMPLYLLIPHLVRKGLRRGAPVAER